MKLVPTTSPNSSWGSPPEKILLGSNEIHVWRASLAESPPQVEVFRYNLAPDEQKRADRFYFQKDRQHFITAHGVLRAILGLYLNMAPRYLSFCYGSHGKPALASKSDGDAIRFNMSHCRGVALYAVTRGREIGIDVEFIRRDLEAEQIANRFFSQSEIATLRALPPSLQRYAFFLCWTRKEAYIKARGEGLSIPLDQFDVSLIPGKAAVLLNTRPDSDEVLGWSLQDLTLDSGYAAALAVEGGGQTLSFWQWPHSEIKH